MATFHRILARLLAFPGPVVAAVNGHAFGAGAILAAKQHEPALKTMGA